MSNKRSILAIIPARGGSKGVPRKNILPLAGKPLIGWAIEAAQASGVIDKLVVSTEDVEIREVALSFGAEVVDRPLELASDTALTEPVLMHALQEVERGGFEPGYLGLIQCTSPFLSAEVIKQATALMIESPEKYDTISTYYTPHYAFRWKQSEDGYFHSEYPVMNKPRRQDLKLEYPYCGAGQFYLTHVDVFKRTQNRYGGNEGRIGGVVIPEEDALQIDSKLDFALADLIMRQRLEK